MSLRVGNPKLDYFKCQDDLSRYCENMRKSFLVLTLAVA